MGVGRLSFRLCLEFAGAGGGRCSARGLNIIKPAAMPSTAPDVPH